MEKMTPWVILLLLIGVPLGNLVVYQVCGYAATISAVIRRWADQSVIPEVLFWLIVLALAGHWFRRWW